MFRDALSARDLSRESLEQLVSIATSLLRVAPEWAAQQLAVLAAHGGASALPSSALQSALSDLLSLHEERCRVVRQAAIAAVEEATAGLPDAFRKLPGEVEAEEHARREAQVRHVVVLGFACVPKRLHQVSVCSTSPAP